MNHSPTAKRLRDYQPPAWTVPSVHLSFKIEEDSVEVRADSLLRCHANSPLRLDKGSMDIERILLDGQPIASDRYEIGKEILTIGSESLDKAEVLTVVNRIYPGLNTALSGIYRSGKAWISQCEAEGFRNITPFVDRPDNLSRFSVRIDADERYPVLLSNGNLVSRRQANGRLIVEWNDPYPKPAYLFAIVIADLPCLEDEFETRSGRKVALQIYAEPNHLPKVGWAMESLKRAFRWEEEKYGLEYDLDAYRIVATDDFNFGAMENKGLNIFNSKCLVGSPAISTDEDLIGIEATVAHEYFHNWTGNRVTLRDWFQLSLKEGLTVHRTWQFTEDVRLGNLTPIHRAAVLRGSQFPEDASPLAHPVRPESYEKIDNFYTATVYEKGAALIQAAETLIGEKDFVEGVKAYLRENDGRACVLEDLFASLTKASGRNLDDFFKWYRQPGTPVVKWRTRYSPDTGRLGLETVQSVPTLKGEDSRQPLLIPVEIALFDGKGNPKTFGENAEPSLVIELNRTENSFEFEGVDEAFTLSLNRGFKAPVIFKNDADWKAACRLMQYETDPFAKWEAGQTLASRLILDSMTDENPLAIPAGIYVDSLRKVLGKVEKDEDLDLASVSLSLPSLAEIGLRCKVFRPRLIHETLTRFEKSLATALERELEAVYRRMRKGNKAFSFERREISRRRLKNRALNWLCSTERTVHLETAFAQFSEAEFFNDKFAALQALCKVRSPLGEKALQEFEAEYAEEFSALNRWFAVQALSSAYGTLERTRRLSKHPRFDRKNPNRIRSLVSAFAKNAPHFHAADGGGYGFLSEQILLVDPVNPFIAASLVQGFSSFQVIEPDLKTLMEKELKILAATQENSPELAENVSRILSPGR